MSSGVDQGARSVVPRWRPSNTFVGSPESGPLKVRSSNSPAISWFDQAYKDWLEMQSAGALADAFSAALSENKVDYIRALAKQIQRFGDRVPQVLQALAEKSLHPKEQRHDPHLQQRWKEVELIGRAVAFLRKKVTDQPNNAFVWHDLSYHYLMLGENEKADRAMSVALAVSRHHRLIVRSASRFFLHIKQVERALTAVSKGPGFAQDPWLLSAHIAIAQGSETSSKFLKQASLVLERRNGGIESSELGMALATEALLNGNKRVAKRLARDAVIDPTENSLAQGVWLSRRLNVDSIVDDVERAKEAYEAQAWDAYYRGDWDASLGNALKWLNDQPFSSRPAILASFIAATFLRDFQLCEEIAKFSLRTNPDDWLLTNNLVVALAEQDKVVEAEREFSRLDIPDSKDDSYATWLATSGLINFRSGDVESGRKLYSESVRLSRTKKDRTSELVGALYRSLEEARIGETGLAAQLLIEVRDGFDVKTQRSKHESHALDALNDQIRALEGARKGA